MSLHLGWAQYVMISHGVKSEFVKLLDKWQYFRVERKGFWYVASPKSTALYSISD